MQISKYMKDQRKGILELRKILVAKEIKGLYEDWWFCGIDSILEGISSTFSIFFLSKVSSGFLTEISVQNTKYNS